MDAEDFATLLVYSANLVLMKYLRSLKIKKNLLLIGLKEN